jgi:mannose-6-phosphate isomerase class I
MRLEKIPFQKINWKEIKPTKLAGETGVSYSKEIMFGKARIRRIKYSLNYSADHWCDKGHIIYCLEGKINVKAKNGKRFILNTGNCCFVGDGIDSHKVSTNSGGELFIID